jgi:hypothetical protein
MPRKPTPIKFCASCGEQLNRKTQPSGRLEALLHFGRRKFCDQACMAVGFTGRFKTLVLPAEGRYRARTIRRRTVCEQCGATWGLDVHHKDENPLNNDPENLIVLCRSCHLKRHKTKTNCSICGLPTKGHGYCDKHYQRFKRHGDPLAYKIPPRKACSVCGVPAHAKGMCGKHYMETKRKGERG